MEKSTNGLLHLPANQTKADSTIMIIKVRIKVTRAKFTFLKRVSLVDGESLVYWLRKLIFRGAWLDHQVKRGALEIVWDEGEAEFAYQHPGGGGRPLLELAPVPSWHELQFKP